MEILVNMKCSGIGNVIESWSSPWQSGNNIILNDYLPDHSGTYPYSLTHRILS